MSVKYLLYSSIDLLYAVSDNEGKIMSSNELFQEYTNHIRPENIFDILFTDSDRNELIQSIEKAQKTPLFPIRVYFQVKQKSNSQRWNLFNVYSILNNLHFVGFSISDVTSITAHEYEIQKKLNDDFKFIVSHEIRQPLSSISGLVNILIDSKDNDEESKYEILQMLKVSVLELDKSFNKLLKKASRQI